MKKYEFTGEVKVEFGVTLNRIRLLVDLPGFRKGSIGGWIESEKNLSHEGNCWVYENGLVYGNAWVYENGLVYGNAWVCGDGRVFGNAWVYGNGRVFGNAWVCGDGRVFGNAWVYGNGRVFGNGRVSGDGQVYENGLVYGVAVVRHRFSDGVCVNVCTDPYGISYSGFEDVSGQKVHYISVGCQDHTVENWLNETYRNQIISSTRFPKKKVETFLKYLDVIISDMDLTDITKNTIKNGSSNRCPITGRFLKKS